jgi:hypothetical protein
MNSDYSIEINNGQGHNIQALFEANPQDEVTLFIDMSNDYNTNENSAIEEYKRAKAANDKLGTKATKEALEKARVNLVNNVSIVASVNGEVVGTMKGLRNVNAAQESDSVYENFRNAIFSNPQMIGAILNARKGEMLPVTILDYKGKPVQPNISVKQVLMGFPNFNYEVNEEGNPVITSRPVNDAEMDAIVDIGYMQEGVSRTQSGEEVNTAFLRTKKESKAKVPFIVLMVGGKRVAYPVKINTESKVDTTEFEQIFNNEHPSDSAKAIALNRWMASKGIDIKLPGNAFVAFGDSNVNDSTFFESKLAQVKAIDYFYNVGKWIDPSTSIEDVIKNQITVDINLNDPFHSPKLMLDYSKMEFQNGLLKPAKNADPSKGAKKVQPNQKTDDKFKCK